jgi:multiple sugar transport system permease protein
MATSTMSEPRVLSYRQRRVLSRAVIYAIMVLVAIIIIIPLIWMFSTSLKLKSQLFSQQIYWIPKVITLQNYQRLLNDPTIPIARWFANTLFVSSVSTVLILFIDSLAAYAYARLEFPGRNVLFTLLLATLFLPGVMFLVPNFLTVAELGMLDHYTAIIIPGLAGVFGVFFMRQFYQTIPRELEEAAYIDGANVFQAFLQVVLPLTKPAMATLAVITFLATWNDFLWALIVLRDRAMLTLQPGLRTLQGAYTSEYGLMMAGAAIVAIPVLLIYIVLQRYVVQSVATSGLKG